MGWKLNQEETYNWIPFEPILSMEDITYHIFDDEQQPSNLEVV